MVSSKIRVTRNFKNNYGMFLNYDGRENIQIGDILIWHGKDAEFIVVDRLSNIGITPHIQPSTVKHTALYTSDKKGNYQLKYWGPAKLATMAFEYKSSSQYSIQAYEADQEDIDMVHLATEIRVKTKQNPAAWNRDWIVAGQLWKANSYTQIVSNNGGATAGVCAQAGALGPFNIADNSLNVSLGYGSSLGSQIVAGAGVKPFFVGFKYISNGPNRSHFKRYGADAFDAIQ